jgi:hypothetical protein
MATTPNVKLVRDTMDTMDDLKEQMTDGAYKFVVEMLAEKYQQAKKPVGRAPPRSRGERMQALGAAHYRNQKYHDALRLREKRKAEKQLLSNLLAAQATSE